LWRARAVKDVHVISPEIIYRSGELKGKDKLNALRDISANVIKSFPPYTQYRNKWRALSESLTVTVIHGHGHGYGHGNGLPVS
jgi:hypothetical protein